MKRPTVVGPLSFVLLGALLGSLVCWVDWTMDSTDLFSCLSLYGGVGATVMGVVGLSRAEHKRTGSKNSE